MPLVMASAMIERSHSRSHSGDGNCCDDTYDGLAPFGFQVSRRHKEFKSHRACSSLSQPNYIFVEPTTVFATPTFSCLS